MQHTVFSQTASHAHPLKADGAVIKQADSPYGKFYYSIASEYMVSAVESKQVLNSNTETNSNIRLNNVCTSTCRIHEIMCFDCAKL